MVLVGSGDCSSSLRWFLADKNRVRMLGWDSISEINDVVWRQARDVMEVKVRMVGWWGQGDCDSGN